MKKYLFYISQNYSFAILRPIQALLMEIGDEVQWFFEGHSVNSAYIKKDEKVLHDAKHIFSYSPDVVIATANSIPGFLPGLKTCVFHGFDAGKTRTNGENDHFKIRGCYDLYCTQGPSTTRVFRQRQDELGYFNVIETGWPALDPLFTTEKKDTSTTPTVLFCSTFSKRLSAAPHLLKTIDSLSQKREWNWIVQFHPKMPEDIVNQYKSIEKSNLQFIETDNIIPLLQKADIMLSDTSSVTSMFLVQEKPVVTFRNINPGPHLLNVTEKEEIEGAIDLGLKKPDQLMSAISRHIEEIHPYRDGNSAQRVIRAIDETINGAHPVRRKKPRNLIRNLKFRKRLNYWFL